MMSTKPTFSPTSSYDLVPYESFPFPQSHPARMAAMAKIFNLPVPTMDNARILELGCSFGGNIIPHAVEYPGAQFTGVDFSAVQIGRGRESVASLGLKNIELRHADILEVARERAEYDFIIAHGVYSWVPEKVQQALLQICREQLSPNGIAYVSYNVYPGWKMREVVRKLMLFHAGGISDPAQKLLQSRAILQYASEMNMQNPSAFGVLLAEEANMAAYSSDYYLFHEHLEPNNRPCYFHEFAEAAEKCGLAYLGEANLVDMMPDRHSPDVGNMVRQLAHEDIILSEQYTDLLINRAFRQTLLIKSENLEALNRSLTLKSIRGLNFATQLTIECAANAGDNVQGVEKVKYKDSNGRVVHPTRPRTKALFSTLVDKSPYTVSFDELLNAVRPALAGSETARGEAHILATDLLPLLSQGLIQTYSESVLKPDAATVELFPFAKWQIGQGVSRLTNRLHQMVNLNENQLKRVSNHQSDDFEIDEVADLVALGLMQNSSRR